MLMLRGFGCGGSRPRLSLDDDGALHARVHAAHVLERAGLRELVREGLAGLDAARGAGLEAGRPCTSWPTESSLVQVTVSPGLTVSLGRVELDVLHGRPGAGRPPLAAGVVGASRGVSSCWCRRTPLLSLPLLSSPAAAGGDEAERETGEQSAEQALHRGGTLEKRARVAPSVRAGGSRPDPRPRSARRRAPPRRSPRRDGRAGSGARSRRRGPWRAAPRRAGRGRAARACARRRPRRPCSPTRPCRSRGRRRPPRRAAPTRSSGSASSGGVAIASSTPGQARGDQQRARHVVAVADVGELQALEPAEALAQRHQVGERLARVVLAA